MEEADAERVAGPLGGERPVGCCRGQLGTSADDGRDFVLLGFGEVALDQTLKVGGVGGRRLENDVAAGKS